MARTHWQKIGGNEVPRYGDRRPKSIPAAQLFGQRVKLPLLIPQYNIIRRAAGSGCPLIPMLTRMTGQVQFNGNIDHLKSLKFMADKSNELDLLVNNCNHCPSRGVFCGGAITVPDMGLNVNFDEPVVHTNRTPINPIPQASLHQFMKVLWLIL